MSTQLLRIPGADGLRALACLLVVWHHTTQRFNPENSASWIQNIHFFGMRGEVVGATNNFRWNDSPVSALSRIAHAGATEWTQPREWAGDMSNMAIPPLVIKDFNMSTVSPGN